MNKDKIKQPYEIIVTSGDGEDKINVQIKFLKGYERDFCKGTGINIEEVARFNYDDNDYIESVILKQSMEYIEITVKVDENGVVIE